MKTKFSITNLEGHALSKLHLEKIIMKLKIKFGNIDELQKY